MIEANHKCSWQKCQGRWDEDFVCNGTHIICLDNLNHVHVQKYVKEVDGYDVTATTNLDSFVDENCKANHNNNRNYDCCDCFT